MLRPGWHQRCSPRSLAAVLAVPEFCCRQRPPCDPVGLRFPSGRRRRRDMHHALSDLRAFGVPASYHNVVTYALGHRDRFPCSSASIFLFLRRLAVAGLLHKVDAKGRQVVFDHFS